MDQTKSNYSLDQVVEVYCERTILVDILGLVRWSRQPESHCFLKVLFPHPAQQCCYSVMASV